MINYIFPTTVVDNFFDNPEQIVNLAKHQKYEADEKNKWPGKRSKCISTINYNFYDITIKKIVALFYPEKHAYKYEADMVFQKVDKTFIDGWVHSDVGSGIATAIIYLNPTYNSNAGTSIYEKKNIGVRNIHSDKKRDYMNGNIIKNKDYKAENNEQFEEVISIKNKYNRMVLFDSHLYHAAQSFDSPEERLAIVIFIKTFTVDAYPIQRSLRVI
jgi:hypothetical protein